MPDLRRNLQTNQNFEGNEANDGNGWPTPLTDPSYPLKLVVTNGSRGETKDFRAMSTDGQDKLSLAEGDGVLSKSSASEDGLSMEVKKTVADSTK